MPAQFIDLSTAAALIQDNTTLAFGGFTLYRRPVAFVYELLRRADRPHNLTLLSFTAGYESDLLVGAGCVSTMRTVYFGLESFGLAPMFTAKANKGEINIVEETEASVVMGLRAGASGVGFMPSHAWIGTDLPSLRPDVKTVTDPYTGETLTAFPTIDIDVAVLHGLQADADGNVLLNNNVAVDFELVYVADTVIVTVEKIVDKVEKSLAGTILPAPGADYIALAPRGAYPTSCYPEYRLGGGELLRYIDACNAGEFDKYLRQVLT
jgi:glutaconate CoA-transferase subunit A